MADILINNEQSLFPVEPLQPLLEKALGNVLEHQGMTTEVEVSVTFVTNEQIHELNRQYRHKDSPTDVLSFPQDDDFPEIPGEFRLLGDIIISLERANEQALEYGHSLEREVAYLAVHGMLHLLGHDHYQEDQKRAMRAAEEEILRILNLGRD